MSYAVKEIYYSLQGEGVNTGRPAVFCRFAGCNLWNGREEDRPKAICQFCDTDFVGTDGPGGGNFPSADLLGRAVKEKWPLNNSHVFVVCTGGEPLLQLDEELIETFHSLNMEIAVETNGSIIPPKGLDWICVSPKAGSQFILHSGDELKLVYPQRGVMPEQFRHLDFQHFELQPLDGPDIEKNTRLAREYCLKHPQWRLSLQTHKILNIP